MPPGHIGGRFTAARLARLLLAWLLLLLVAAPALGAAGASDPDNDTARDLLGGRRSSPLLDNCTVERVQFKAWARKKVIPVTKTAKVRVKVKPARGPLANATLVLSVSPEGTAVYKKSSMYPPAVRSAKRSAREPVVLGPGRIVWSIPRVEKGRTQGFKVKLALTECAAGNTVSVSVSLLYQGSAGATCAVASYPVKVSSLGSGLPRRLPGPDRITTDHRRRAAIVPWIPDPPADRLHHAHNPKFKVKPPGRHKRDKVLPCGGTPSPSPGPSPAPTIPYIPVVVGQRCQEGILYPIYVHGRGLAARTMQSADASQRCYDRCVDAGFAPVRTLYRIFFGPCPSTWMMTRPLGSLSNMSPGFPLQRRAADRLLVLRRNVYLDQCQHDGTLHS